MQAAIDWKYVEQDGLPPEPSSFEQWCPKYLAATVENGIEALEFANGLWFDAYGNETSYTVYAWAEVNVPKYPMPGYRCPHCYADVTKQVEDAAHDIGFFYPVEFKCPACRESVEVLLKGVTVVQAS